MPLNGKALAAAREEMGLTQFQLAELTRRKLPDGSLAMVRPEHISLYERGKRQPGVDSFMVLCNVTGKTPYELWTDVAERAQA